MEHEADTPAGLIIPERYILATILNYPVVPEGDEEIRLQISANHTEKDIDYVLTVLTYFARQER